MAALIGMPRAAWKRQPVGFDGMDWRNSLTNGLRRAVNCGFDRYRDLVENVEVSKTLEGGVIEAPKITTPLGIGYSLYTTSSNTVTTFPSWTNTTNSASACMVFMGQLNPAWEIGASGNQDHFPFSNALYTDAFWSSRWASGIALLPNDSWNGPHIVVMTVRNGNQNIYHNGRLWHSNTLTGNFLLPGTLYMFKRAVDSLSVAVACFAWDRYLLKDEAISISNNPWQLFKPHIARFISIPSSGPVTSKIPVFMHYYRQLRN